MQKIAHRGKEHLVALEGKRQILGALPVLQRVAPCDQIEIRDDPGAAQHDPAEADGREVIHGHRAQLPCPVKGNAGGEIDARKGGVAQTCHPGHPKAGQKRAGHVQLVAKVQQHAPALRLRGIACRKAPVLAPLPHVMADAEGTVVD